MITFYSKLKMELKLTPGLAVSSIPLVLQSSEPSSLTLPTSGQPRPPLRLSSHVSVEGLSACVCVFLLHYCLARSLVASVRTAPPSAPLYSCTAWIGRLVFSLGALVCVWDAVLGSAFTEEDVASNVCLLFSYCFSIDDAHMMTSSCFTDTNVDAFTMS